MPPATPTAIDLFPEILLEIFQYGPTNADWKHYSLVCSEWRFPAQERLFTKLTLKNLSSPSPKTLPYSAMAKDPRHAHILQCIRHLSFVLKSNSAVDPSFPTFLRRIMSLRELSFFHNGRWLFKDNYGPDMQGAIYHLVSLPTLESLQLSVDYFPVGLITACKSVSSLTVGFIQGLNTIDLAGHFVLGRSAQVMPETLRLFGNMAQLGHFTQTVLSDPKYNVSLKRIKTADLFFVQVIPCLGGTIFSVLGNVRAIDMHFQVFHTGQSLSTLAGDRLMSVFLVRPGPSASLVCRR